MLRGSARESKIYCANERLPENDNGFTKRLYTCFLHVGKHGGYEYYYAICKQQNGMQSFLDPHCRGSMPIVVAAFFYWGPYGAHAGPGPIRAHAAPCGPMLSPCGPMRAHADLRGAHAGPCWAHAGPCGPMRAHAGPASTGSWRAVCCDRLPLHITSKPTRRGGAASGSRGATRKRRQALAVE